MKLLGNLLWLVLGGLVLFLLYGVFGLLMCCTIVGIPFGVQLWKLGALALCPFGSDVSMTTQPSCLTLVFNVLWLVLGWWEIALVHLFFAAICAVTIVGIPFAVQHIKLMKMSLMPFGSKIS